MSDRDPFGRTRPGEGEIHLTLATQRHPHLDRDPSPAPVDLRTSTRTTISNASITAHDNLGLVGVSSAIARTRRETLRFASSNAPVLIYGDTGTGKELVARALHDRSPRSARPFVAINVACLPRDVIANELFGHDRGAYTGALGIHRGLFEQASGGTLFLDEIAELPLDLQATILRVIETGEVRRLGGDRTHKCDVRIVAATHHDMFELVRTNAFRADLWYRLHVLSITLAPLRERREDIPQLARHALLGMQGEVGERRLSADALATLCGASWPGNVRQFFAVLHRSGSLTDGRTIDRGTIIEALAAFEGTHRRSPSPIGYDRRLDLTETTFRKALAKAGGNISRASRSLGVARSTLREHLARVNADQ